jgi:hypothetical protein
MIAAADELRPVDEPATSGRPDVSSSRALGALAAVLVAGGFFLRLAAASGIRLNGDEALHWATFHQPSAALVYDRSLRNAHPPLYFEFMYVWSRLGTSELFLRMPSIVFGTLFTWQTWRFVAGIADRRAALVATALVALSPSLVALTAEVRGYGMFLFFTMASVAALDPALTEGTRRKLVAFAVPLLFAILTHYAALWIAITMAIYSMIRLRGASSGRRRDWFLLWTGAAGLYGFLFCSHVSALHGGALEHEAIQTWLGTSYFQAGRDSVLTWIPLRTQELAWWLTRLRAPWGPRLGWILASAFLLGAVWMTARRRLAVLLLVMPFLLAGAASILHLYPFGGTRHSSYLAPLLAAGVGVLATETGGRRAWLAVLLALATAILPWSENRDLISRELRERQATYHVEEALNYARDTLPTDALLCVDHQTQVMLEYYAMRGEFQTLDIAQTGFFERRLFGHPMLSPRIWHDDAASFHDSLDRLAAAYHRSPEQTVWVINMGLEENLMFDLRARDGIQALIAPRVFGPYTSVFGFHAP